MPKYDDYAVTPQAGRFVKEDGTEVNLADIVEDIQKVIREDPETLIDGETLAADESYDYTAMVDLKVGGHKGAEVQLSLDSGGTTDNLVFSVFGSRDGINFDTLELYTMTVDATSGDTIVVSLLFNSLPAYVRFGVKNAAVSATDTFLYSIWCTLFR